MISLWEEAKESPLLAAEAILALLKHGKPTLNRVEMAQVGALLVNEGISHLRKLSGVEFSVRVMTDPSYPTHHGG